MRRPLTDIACSIARASEIVGERWTLLILRDLFAGLTRFEDIRRDLGIASNVLTTRLAKLEQHGIVEQRRYQENPVRHEYLLTDMGRDLYPMIASLIAWGDRWLAGADGPPALIVHTDCGHATKAVTVCAECGGKLHAENVFGARGPGGRIGPGTAVIGERLAATPGEVSER
ncbi:helix-turn-helix transcriptional regulator [Nocardia cyriacigeorgica]|uniref:Helix-turn-helix transcriptional regulator n=1 Tax=Nocardia cyriacigeorgica TaxID=135487 RepID=A0A6P1DFT7_9NOCA|nr:helix-turn-helix domain-containing protein [Nocardia cyriacigeorgica]NEW40192.1 helix-turn-helix transcriptional regulator [Nocardia cyriacigeorgica]NEW47272.1 helix-turn-helix transcriptional regulator [Nocardia cyriacigeorgica]NEW51793.1 helix-turn-helix transcriptional regulator [Nocardia cyriacigeorgica]NEW59026.1 helix-turn-helix transcriptional regulator [Nocardia cyriacigeorgica]